MKRRILDITLSSFGLIIVLPVMLVIAALVKLSSSGPALFRQKRTGLKGELFNVLKFRTMVHTPQQNGPVMTASNDTRITPLGRILRKSKLDELPQLFNVLRGDMSFVGPRPLVPETTRKYTPDMLKVFDVRPGITGLATLHFRDEEDLLAKVSNPTRFYDEILTPFKVELALQDAFVDSFRSDLKILTQTVWMLSPMSRIWPVKEPEHISAFKQQAPDYLEIEEKIRTRLKRNKAFREGVPRSSDAFLTRAHNQN